MQKKILFALFLNFQLLFSQQIGFGVVKEFPTSKDPLKILSGNFSGNKKNDFVVVSKNSISLFKKNNSNFWIEKKITISNSILDAALCNINGDEFNDIALFLDDNSVQIVFGKKSDSLFSQRIFDAQKKFENISLVDLTNDGKEDLLLYGKSSLGIRVVEQLNDKQFYYSTTLFREKSYTKIFATDINKDKLVDIVVYDYMQNVIQLYLQRGKFRFSSANSWKFFDKVSNFNFVDLNNDEILDFIVSFENSKKIKIFYGDEVFDFKENTSLEFQDYILSFDICDIEKDNFPELVTLHNNQKSMIVFWNSKSENFKSNTSYSTGFVPSQILFEKFENGFYDALVLSNESAKIKEFVNSKNVTTYESETQFSSCVNPFGLIHTDLNDDQIIDFIVSSSTANLFAIHFGKNKNKLDGQFQFEIPNSYDMKFVKDKMLVSHLEENYISILKQNSKIEFETEIKIPTKKKSDILFAKVDEKKLLRFYTSTVENGYLKIFQFTEIKPQQFIEIEVENLFQEILNATIGDVTDDGIEDIVFATNDEKNKTINIFIAKGKSEIKNKISVVDFILPQKILSFNGNAKKILLWSVDLDNNSQFDLIGNVMGEKNFLFVSYRKNSTTFSDKIQTIDDVKIFSNKFLQFVNYNSDKRKDLVFYNSEKKSFEYVLVKYDSSLEKSQTIFTAESIGNFIVSDFNQDTNMDIALTDVQNGILKIIWGK